MRGGAYREYTTRVASESVLIARGAFGRDHKFQSRKCTVYIISFEAVLRGSISVCCYRGNASPPSG